LPTEVVPNRGAARPRAASILTAVGRLRLGRAPALAVLAVDDFLVAETSSAQQGQCDGLPAMLPSVAR